MTIKDLYLEDQHHIRRWGKHYTDNQFYLFNRAIRRRLAPLLKSKRKRSPRELWMAGMILHHGNTLGTSRSALRFAQESYGQGYKPAKTLVAQATDRLLQLQGKPQKFGTQAARLKNGKLKLYVLDGTITDAERKAYGLPSLKQLTSYLNT